MRAAPEDVAWLRRELAARKCPAWVIVKIEKPQAVRHLEAIVAATDGVMVARGDLGVEMDVARVPAIQKRVIALCNQAHRPVITATQMLNSMEHSSRPTRAEASDVFNAVLDGTDAVMLSGESAVGRVPRRGGGHHAADLCGGRGVSEVAAAQTGRGYAGLPGRFRSSRSPRRRWTPPVWPLSS